MKLIKILSDKVQIRTDQQEFGNVRINDLISYTPEGDLLYENLIKTLYMQAANGIRFEKGTPVTLRIIARFEPPKSASKKRQQQMLSGEIPPLKKPDMRENGGE